jgi:hypothetical protein
MIGRYTAPDGSTVATLMDNLSWRCNDEVFRRYLRSRWPASDYSPADGEPGFRMLYQVQEAIGGGTVEILREPGEYPEGVVF